MKKFMLLAVLASASALPLSAWAQGLPAANPPGAPSAPMQAPLIQDIAVPPPSDPHLAKALDYISVAGIKRLAVAKARFALLPITQQAHRMTKDTSPALWARFQSLAWKALEPKMPDMVLGVAKIYAGLFSDAELDAMIAFEKSPAGQKLQQMRPQIARAELNFTRGWADRVSPEIAKQVLDSLQSQPAPKQN